MSMVIYEGPSLLDHVATDDNGNVSDVITKGTPIVVLAVLRSTNSKTGDMIQTYILRQDMSPTDAIKQGADTAICGGCIHRSKASGGQGTCYVVKLFVNQRWREYVEGRTETFDLTPFVGRPLRFGAYGDPAAIPFDAWAPFVSVASGWTGYTHQWRTCDQRYSQYLMASCDSDDDQRDAIALGWRVYRVYEQGAEKPSGTIPCPWSDDRPGGPRAISCADCLKCSGLGAGRRGHVAIAAHGTSGKRFRTPKSLPLSVITTK